MVSGKQVFQVYVGDTTLYFMQGKLYQESRLRRIFRKKIRQCHRCAFDIELFPGLVLQDGEGNLWKPELQVHLVPVKPEE